MTAMYTVFLLNTHGASKSQEPHTARANTKNRAMEFVFGFGEEIAAQPRMRPPL